MQSNLKKRVCPKLLIEMKAIGTRTMPVLVTTRQFEKVIPIGEAVSQAKMFEAQLADELLVINISGVTGNNSELPCSLIQRLAEETFMPLTVGGGVTSLDDFEKLLRSGADKVSINSAAIKNPSIVSQAAKRYGSQCVVVSIDSRGNRDDTAPVLTQRGSVPTGLSLVDWAKQVVDLGAGEILLTDVDRDGMKCGLNYELANSLSSKLPVPVILSGGCGLANHFVDGFTLGNVDAIAAGTFFCFQDQSPMQTRAHIANAGINIRCAS